MSVHAAYSLTYKDYLSVTKRAKPRTRATLIQLFTAGCGRSKEGPADLTEVAYTELAFPECPTCVHRVVPEGGPPFCRWLGETANPFAGLAAFAEGLE